MHNQKKTKTAENQEGFLLSNNDHSGVLPLASVEAGFERALLIYRTENDYFLESFKLFYDFLIESSPLNVHLTCLKMYFKMMEVKAPGVSLFDNEEEEYDFDSLIQFLAALSIEHRQSDVKRNIAMRISLQEQSLLMRKFIDFKQDKTPNN